MASSKKIRGLLVEIGGDTTKLQESLKNVDKTTNSLSKELRGINTLLKFDPSNVTLLDQKTKVLSESIEETEKRLEALKQAQEQLEDTNIDKNSVEYRDLQREIEATTQKLATLQNENSKWTTAGKKLEDYGNSIKNVGNEIDSVGTKLTTGLTLPIVAAGTYFVKASSDFESAFAGVKKTVEATDEELANLKDGIIEMSKELPASATEIANVSEAAGQLGIQNDAILSFTKTMIDLGNATNMSADEAATSLARFANITQMSQKDFDKLGSVVVDLGNNLATTESEIVEMGLRLAGAGNQVGMTESQILSFAGALSSVGIEAEAGGTAFSKVMIKMQLAIEEGSEQLSQFAEVSGMTVEEFKRAFKEDASKAIIDFINGLSSLDQEGKTAIGMLDEMGLSEVRLRDSLLRASGANEVFNKSMEIGNNAWNENIALTKEASQKYETTQSQFDIAKNKLNSLAISFGDNLLPHINDFLDIVDDLVSNFSKLTKEEQKNILKTMGIVASIGPAIKIFGSLTKTIGATTEKIGLLSQAISVVKTGAEPTSKSVANLSKVISGMTTPVGLTITSITVLIGLFAALSKAADKEDQELVKLNNQIKDQKQAREDLIATQKEQLTSSLSEIDNTERLVEELELLVDENGKIKDGYQSRVDFILGELNNAYGTEYKSVDGVIQKYDELQGEIDSLILKKRANIILSSQEEAYENAIKNQTAAMNTLSSAKDKVKEKQKKVNEAQKEFNDYVAQYGNDPLDEKYIDLSNALLVANNNLDKAKNSYSDAKEVADDYYKDIIRYETNSQLIREGSIESLNEVIANNSRTYQENGKTVELTLGREVQNQIEATKQAKEQYESRYNTATETEKKILQSTADTQQKQLNQLINNLVAQTSTINENSPDVIAAWKTLATESKDEYNEVLSTIDQSMRNQIVSLTGVPYSEKENMKTAWNSIGQSASDGYNSKLSTIPDDTKNTLEKTANAIKSKSNTVSKESKDLADKAVNKLNKYSESVEAGENFGKGVACGIKNQNANVSSAAAGLAAKALSSLQQKWDIHSPSKKSQKLAEFFDLGIIRGFKSQEDKVVNSASSMAEKILENFDLNNSFQKMNDIQGVINQKITDATRTIFTTPQINFNVQKMDQANLDAAFKYINNKFGSAY